MYIDALSLILSPSNATINNKQKYKNNSFSLEFVRSGDSH